MSRYRWNHITADEARALVTDLLASESVTGETKDPRTLGVESANTPRNGGYAGGAWTARTVIVERHGIRAAVVVSISTGSNDYNGDTRQHVSSIQLRTCPPVYYYRSGAGPRDAKQTRTYAVKEDHAHELTPEQRVNMKGLRKALNTLLDKAEGWCNAEHAHREREKAGADARETLAVEMRECMDRDDVFPSEGQVDRETLAWVCREYEFSIQDGGTAKIPESGNGVFFDIRHRSFTPAQAARLIEFLSNEADAR